MKQRIVQFCHRLYFGDAISNHMLELWRVFADNGYESVISCSIIDNKLPEKNVIIPVEKLILNSNDVFIYHACGNYYYAYILGEQECRKIMVFHNETPPVFFNDYTRPVGINARCFYKPHYPSFFPHIINSAIKAIFDAKKMKSIFPVVWTVSHYNASCLKKMGFKNIEVLPIPFKRSGIKVIPTASIIDKYADTRNILFVGRLVSNKKQVDIIRTFAYYHRIVPNSRLFLVGDIIFSECYRDEFLSFADSLGVRDCVHIPGIVSNEDLEAYWRCASLFLSMSEHEGFCVPILEALAHEVPVLAYASSAIPETLGEAGVLFYEKNFPYVAEVMNTMIENPELIRILKTAGLEHIKKYDPDKLAIQAIELLQKE